jgi:hypothetical protein
MARKKTSDPVRRITNAKMIAAQGAALADYAEKALHAAGQLRIRNKPVESLLLDRGECAVLASLPITPLKVRKKLAKAQADVSVAEVAGMVLAIADAFVGAEVHQKIILLTLVKKLADCLQVNIVMPKGTTKSKKARTPRAR